MAKKKKLSWIVYYHNFNGRKIETYDIFNHSGFYEDTKKNYKKNKENREEFDERLRRDLLYYFWSKCEWEVVVKAWAGGDGNEEVKIDVYDQVMNNFPVFKEYVWGVLSGKWV